MGSSSASAPSASPTSSSSPTRRPPRATTLCAAATSSTRSPTASSPSTSTAAPRGRSGSASATPTSRSARALADFEFSSPGAAPIPIPIPEQLAEFEAVAAAAGYDLSDPYVYAEASAKVAPLYPVYWAASSKEETMEELWRIVRMGESSNKWTEENMRDREDTGRRRGTSNEICGEKDTMLQLRRVRAHGQELYEVKRAVRRNFWILGV